MLRRRDVRRTRQLAWCAVAVLSMLLATGCSLIRRGGAVRTEGKAIGPAERRREATKDELLAKLRANMSRLATLTAKAKVDVIRTDVLVPTTIEDDLKRRQNKPYSKDFDRAQVTGGFLLARGPSGSTKIKFFGEIIGPSTSFMLLARDKEFVVILPNMGRKGRRGPRGRVLKGTADRQLVRRKDIFSIRPQDIGDLLLHDETFAAQQGAVICYMETWKDFYVLTFLRPDWPEHIFSKIWMSRRDLSVAIHQIFDGAGELIAEGRFGGYRAHRGRGSEVEAVVPSQWLLLWPRDNLVMAVVLSNEKVNESIPENRFKVKIPRGYEVEQLRELERPEG